MTRPGVSIVQSDARPPSRTAPTDTGQWFVAGLTEKGGTVPVLVESLQAFDREFGGRVSYSILRDCVEAFFAVGGRRVYVTRVVGPAATKASVILKDAGNANTLKVEAASSGDWANGATGGLKVAVVAGDTAGTFRLVVSTASGVLETSPELADVAAAVEWSTSSAYIRASALGANDPAVVAATNLTAGTDDRAAIVDATYTAALARFGRDLGPGQVSFPGRTTTAAHTALATHCRDLDGLRVPIGDAPDDPDVADVAAAGTALRVADPELCEHIALFENVALIPGKFPGTTREVPYSPIAAGLIAAVDAEGNPNVAAAGEKGRAPYVLGLKHERSDAERDTLTTAGVNTAKVVGGEVRTYGFRTVADPAVSPLHWQLANVRTDMAVAARGAVIAERYVFAQLDGKGLTVARFGGELSAMLAELETAGALFATDASPGFRVDVGPSVNPPESIAAGDLKAVAAIRRSPFAEFVEVSIVKSAITEAL